MDPERIKDIRDNQLDAGGLGIVLYFDLPQSLIEGWANNSTCFQTYALSERLSVAVWRFLMEASTTDIEGIRDEASRALNLFLDCGTARQAFLVDAIEGLYNTKPMELGEQDRFAGYNEEVTRGRYEVSRRLQNLRPPELNAEEAVSEAERLLDENGEGGMTIPGSWLATEHIFTRYLRSCGKSANTARTYCSGVKLFWRWCLKSQQPGLTPFTATKPDLRYWLADRLSQVSPARCHNDLAGLRHFYAWAIECGYRDDDPSAGLKVKRDKTLPTAPLSSAEFLALMDACYTERERLIIMLLGSTGMRISELASLRTESVDWNTGEIRVLGKGGKERLLTPNNEAVGILRIVFGMFPEPGPIFPSAVSGNPLSANSIRKLIYDLAERAKLEHIHPHRFRAYFATQFMEQYGDIQALQGAMGHESIEVTAKYSEATRGRRTQEQMRGLDLTRPLQTERVV